MKIRLPIAVVANLAADLCGWFQSLVQAQAVFAISRSSKSVRERSLHGTVNNYNSPLLLIMEAKTKTIEQFKTHDKDTGSADVQVALLTHRINHLTEHLQTNKKDHSSRRGLLMMVGQRRRLLDYLQSTDLGRYQTVTKKLKLRH
jgi:small subunit ribosomal protein S15